MTRDSARNGTITVEVLIKDEDGAKVNFEAVRQEVRDFIKERYAFLTPNAVLKGYEFLVHGEAIDTIEVIDYHGTGQKGPCYAVEEVQISISVYSFTVVASPRQRRSMPGISDSREEQHAGLQVTDLPSGSLHHSWRSLIYCNSLPSRLLNYITRAISFARDNSVHRSETFVSSRLILLHGPPGSGKTTLCRALAQKATIRMSQEYAAGKLVEIDANSLLSKFFSESGKQVSKVFRTIQAMASDKRLLVFVLLDEVESIAGKRETVTNGGDCNDSLRATNQLLTALDSLRHQTNVVLLCTSNLLQSLDSAFLSRVEVNQYVPSPCAAERYSIIRSCLIELQRCGKIKPDEQTVETNKQAAERHSELDQDELTEDEVTPIGGDDDIYGHVHVPSYGEMLTTPKTKADKLTQQMESLSIESEGMSGRDLRRLPTLALSLVLHGNQHFLHEVTSAMGKAMKELKRRA